MFPHPILAPTNIHNFQDTVNDIDWPWVDTAYFAELSHVQASQNNFFVFVFFIVGLVLSIAID